MSKFYCVIKSLYRVCLLLQESNGTHLSNNMICNQLIDWPKVAAIVRKKEGINGLDC